MASPPRTMERVPIMDPTYNQMSRRDFDEEDGEDEASIVFDDSSLDSYNTRKYWYRSGAAAGIFMVVAFTCSMFLFPATMKAPQSAMESKFENQEMYDAYLCHNFDGMYNPIGTVCCSKKCGKYCSAANCQDGPGGASACCSKYMPLTCGKGVKAPCKLNSPQAYTPVTAQCVKFGGIDHPLGNKCCDAKCGAQCGAVNCWESGPGYEGCCSSHVNKYCKVAGKAPCMLTAEPVADQCHDFGGILHPLKTKCCGKFCGGQCGSAHCWRGNGGARSCCRDQTGLPDCSPLSGSPCNLVPPVDSVFYGVMGINTDDGASFETNPAVKISVQQALAQSVGIPIAQVAITGISLQVATARRLFTTQLVSVGYEITVPISSMLTIEKVIEQQDAMPTRLNTFLRENGVTPRVGSISMPPPVLRRTSMTTSTTTITSTTTSASTCAGVVCPTNLVLRRDPQNIPCVGEGCSVEECCVQPITTTTPKLPPPTPVPTTTPAASEAKVSFGGAVAVKATGVSATQMKTAMIKSLAVRFGVTEKSVAVTATESRRLDALAAATRQLVAPGNWAISFIITTVSAQAVAIQTEMTTLSTDSASLNMEMTTQLKVAGASDAAVNSMTVESFKEVATEPLTTAPVVTPPAKATTTAKPKKDADAKAATTAEPKKDVDSKAAATAKPKKGVDAKAATTAEPKKDADAKATTTAEPKKDADAKAGTTAEPKKDADAKAATTAEPKKNAAAKAATTAKPKKGVDAKAATTAKPKKDADAKATTTAEPKTDADAKAATTAEPKKDADAKAATTAEPKKDVDAKATTTADPKKSADAKAATTAKTKKDADAKDVTTAKPKKDANAKATTTAEPKKNADAKAATTAEPKKDTDAKAKTTAKPKKNADTKAATTAEPKKDVDAKAATTAEPKKDADAKSTTTAEPKKADADKEK